jgi:hypothetical protein
MIGHPILLSVSALDLLAVAALSASLFAVFPVSVRWHPGSPDRAQLLLERRAEAGAMTAHAATVFLLLSTGLLVVAFSLVLPGTIPGAMCGTGVLQAVGDAGVRALGFRLLALLCLSAWQLLEGLNRSRPDAPLTETGVRVLLASSPVVLLGIAETQRALWGLDFGQAVDCCARIYDPVSGGGARGAGIEGRYWAAAFVLLSAAAGAVAAALRWSDSMRPGRVWMLAAFVCFWLPAAAVSLVHVFSPAIFGVLAHPCPWCLFLPEHGMVGFVLFGAMAVAAREGLLVPVAAWTVRIDGALRVPAADRVSKAAGRVLAALAVFFLFSAGPTLLWRIRYGVWISG